MFTLPLAATTRHLRMQEGAGLKMETSLQTSAVMQTKRQQKVGAERKGDGNTKSTVRAGSVIHQGVEQEKKKSLGALLADLRGLCGT